MTRSNLPIRMTSFVPRAGEIARVTELLHGNRLLSLHAIREVFAFEDPRDRITRRKTDESFGSELRHPSAVEIDHGLCGFENLEDLQLVGFGVSQDFILRQLLSRDRSSRRIAARVSPLLFP